MNEKIWRFLFFVLLGFSLLFAGASVAATVRCITAERELGECRAELGRIRNELQTASDQQRELREIVRDSKAILDRSTATLSGLREQLRAIRINYEAMEACLRNYRCGDGSSDCDTGSDTSE